MSYYDDKTKRDLAVYVSIFLLLVMGIAVGGYVSFRNFEQQFRRQAEYQISAIAELKVNELVNWRKERLADAELIYKNPAFFNLAARYINNPQDTEAREDLRHWLDEYEALDQYDRVRLLNAQGVSLISVPDGIPPLGSTVTQLIPAALQTKQITLVDFYRNELDQRIYLTLLIPILDAERSNRVIGFVTLRIDPQVYLYPYIQSWPINSASAETLLIRRDGDYVLYLNQLRFVQDAALTLRFPLTDTDIPAVRAALGQTGIMEGVDYRGKAVVADVHAVPDSDWYLVSKMDTAEVYAPLRARLWQTLGIVGMAIFVAGAGLALVWRQQRILFYRAQVEATEVLRESEDKFKYVFEYSVVGKSITYLGGEVHLNKAFCDMLGYSAEEMQERKWQEVTHPDDIELTQNAIGALISGEKESARFVKRFIHKNGSIVWVDLSSTLRRDQQGKPLYLMTTVIDITERKQTEEALRENEERFRTLYDNATIGLYRTTPDGHIIMLNPTGVRMLGYGSFDEIMKRDLENPEFQAEHPRKEFREKLEREGVIRGLERKMVQKDGSIIFVRESAKVFRDENGNALYYDGSFEDVTERKRAEEALRKSEALYRQAIEVSGAVPYLQTYTGSGTGLHYDFIGEGIRKITGYGPEEFTGALWDSLTQERFVVDDLAEYSFEEAIEKVRSGESSTWKCEHRIRARDGKTHWVFESAVELRDGNGIAHGSIGLFQDITERKMAEQALRESENLYRKMNENSPLGMHFYQLTADGQLVFTGANPAADKLLGLDNSQFIGQTIQDAFPPLIQTEMPSRYRGVAAEGIPWSTEQIAYEDDRIMGAFEVSAFQTTPGNMVAVFADVTERKQAEEKINQLNLELEQRVVERTVQLEITNKELEAFSYSVSHDLRAPLRGIDGWSQALLEDYHDQLDEQGKQYIERVRSETQRMGHLIDDMLQLSRLTRAEMTTGPVDLSALAQTIAGRLQAEASLRHVDLNIQAGLTAEGDVHLLEIVLTNLLDNAFKFTAKRAEARIEFGQTELQGQRVFFVRDNGAGFDMTYAQKIFGAFQRMHKVSEFPGTGVGLAIVQRIIHRHGGRVWAEAEVERGTTFYFTLGD